jgi:hypothetical protein
MHHFLGEVEEHRQFRSICSHIVARADHPWGDATTIAGIPALPVSIALEYAASLGDWVAPEGWPPRRLTELRDVRVDLAALSLRDGRLPLQRKATGSRLDGRWCVDVTMHRADDHREVVRARLVYCDSEVSLSKRPELPGRNGASLDRQPQEGRQLRGLPDGLAWPGLAVPAADWWGQTEPLRGKVRPTKPADLWSLPIPPYHVLPTNALESILAAHATVGSAADRLLTIRALRQEVGGPEDAIEGSPETGQWTVFDAAGSPILVVDEMRLQ